MISLIIPAYNEATGIQEVYRRVSNAANSWREDYEIIVVDDGSRDETLQICSRLAANDKRLKVLSLSRNFGHQAALSAGLCYARGDIVAVIDADLQDPPEELARFIDKCREGFDVVYGIRTKRKENVLKHIGYFTYYRILRKLSEIEMPVDAGDFCVMSRRIVNQLNMLPERNRYVRGLRAWVGYRQIGLAYERDARHFGAPKYTLRKLVRLGLDGVINFSYKPLQIVMGAGIVIAFCTFLLGIGVFWQSVGNITVWGYNPHQARGWTSLILSILFLAGVQLIALGVIGEYIGRLFEEAKGRPVFLVREAINFDSRDFG